MTDHTIHDTTGTLGARQARAREITSAHKTTVNPRWRFSAAWKAIEREFPIREQDSEKLRNLAVEAYSNALCNVSD